MDEAAPRNAAALMDAWRSALAAALATAVYGGLVILLLGLVPFGDFRGAGIAFLLGYLAAVLLHAATRVVAAILRRLGHPLPAFLPPLVHLLVLPVGLGQLFQARDLSGFAGPIAFVGASLS